MQKIADDGIGITSVHPQNQKETTNPTRNHW
jgi:hypothetical protein